MINPLALEQAILQTQSSSLVPELDVLAHYSNLNLAASCFKQAEGEVSFFEGELSDLSSGDAVYAKNQYAISEHEGFYQIIAGIVVFKSSFSADTFKHIRQSLGSHNDNKKIDFYFSERSGDLLIPYELQSIVKKTSIPSHIDIKDAYQQNPLHPCFHHQLIPSPVAGVAVYSKIESMIGFVVHPKLLISALDAKLSSDTEDSLKYDTKIALNLLNLKYSLSVNKKVIEALEDLDEQLINMKDEVAYMDIEGNW